MKHKRGVAGTVPASDGVLLAPLALVKSCLSPKSTQPFGQALTTSPALVQILQGDT